MRDIRHATLLVAVFGLVAFGADEANGQGTSGVIEEIVVTANKREQNASDVGISVSAFSGDQLEALGIDNTVEITQQIPNLQVSAWSPNVTIFNIRGISQNNFQDNLEAPVAVYLDDAYMGSINGLSGQLFDVERVEVLRGPQGTLFGRNATGGLIHYISRDASEEETNGYIKAGFGNFNRWSFEGAIGGSLSDNVRVRIAGRVEEADGYIVAAAALPGVFEAGTQDLGGEDGSAIKATLQVDFSDSLSGDFWIKHSQDNSIDTGGYVLDNCNPVANGYCSVNAAGIGDGNEGVTNGITGAPASPFDNFNETPGFLDRDTNIIQASFDYDFSNNFRLKSITNFTDVEKHYREDGDALPLLILNFDTNVDYKQFSQEFRLSGSSEHTQWQVGAYFLDIEHDGDQFVVGAPIIGAAFDAHGGADDPSLFLDNFIDSENISIFGQVEFDLSDALKFTGGLRYSVDDKSIDAIATLFNGSFGDAVVLTDEGLAAVIPGVNSIDYKDWAGKLGLDYDISENTLLFASLNRGMKGGNWTLVSEVSPQNFRHDEEVLHSLEVGIKTTLADNRVRLNATAFVYDYDDYQAFAVTGGTPQVTNSDASAYGAEFELFWSPTDNLDVIFGGAFLDTEVDSVDGPAFQIGPDFTGGNGPAVVGACTLDAPNGVYICDFPEDTVVNAEFPNAPSFSFNYLLRYNRAIGDGNFAIQFDGAYYDDQFLEVTNGPSSIQESYGISNLSLNWTDSLNNWDVSLFANNIFDEEYRAYTLNLGILGTTSYFAPPLTYGMSIKRNFN